jgi:hypothetical protein
MRSTLLLMTALRPHDAYNSRASVASPHGAKASVTVHAFLLSSLFITYHYVFHAINILEE